MKKIRELFSRMKQDNGGYAAITIAIICIIVISAFVGVTLSLVERSYTAQKREFALQKLVYQARGDIEAFMAIANSMSNGKEIESKIKSLIDQAKALEGEIEPDGIQLKEVKIKKEPFETNESQVLKDFSIDLAELLKNDEHRTELEIVLPVSYTSQLKKGVDTTVTVTATLLYSIESKTVNYDQDPTVTAIAKYSAVDTQTKSVPVQQEDGE